MAFSATGGCLCGAVRYQLSGEPVSSMHCHCENCRKASGAAMLTWVTVDTADFEWLAGEPRRFQYVSDHYEQPVERWSCAACGSQLGWRRLDAATVDLTAGSFDDPDLITPTHHVFTRGQVRWLKTADDLPRYPVRRDKDT